MRRPSTAIALATVTLTLVALLVAGWLAGRPAQGAGWLAAAAIVPLAALTWVLARPLRRSRQLVLGGGYLPFLVCYLLLFGVADSYDLLDGRREVLAGYSDLPTNRFGLSRLGDWHYAFLPEPEETDLLALVSMEPFDEVRLALARRRFAGLIRHAREAGAVGIAFDYYLEGETYFDRELCEAVAEARTAGFPVVFGFRHERTPEGGIVPAPLPDSLRSCFVADELASLAGYLESDGRVRMVPLYMPGAARLARQELASLSLRVARAIDARLAGLEGRAPGLDPPASELLQFVDLRELPRLSDLLGSDADRRALDGRFVLVGSAGGAPGDSFPTPFGELDGVEIHARAIHSLLPAAAGRAAPGGRRWISRAPAPWTLGLVVALCYGLAFLQYQGTSWRTLLLAAGLVSLGLLVAAAASMRFGRIWIDVSYPLGAIWPLTLLLRGGARLVERLRQRDRQVVERLRGGETLPDEATPTEPVVFVSYAHRDREAMRRLATELEGRDVPLWIDEQEIRAGDSWLERLRGVIGFATCALLLRGPEGPGKIQAMEIDECLIEASRRDLVVVTVLLPGGPSPDEVRVFQRRLDLIDLRDGRFGRGADQIAGLLAAARADRVRPAA